MPAELGPVPGLRLIAARLLVIFPEGVEHRNYLIRDMAVRTLFVMMYAGAIEGSHRWVRPSMVTDMTDKAARALDAESREAWYSRMLSQKKAAVARPWYKPNSREPIRDETIRLGLVPNGAVIERTLPTNSGLPRYALATDFATLMDESLSGDALERAISVWQKAHLSAAARARLSLIQAGATATGGHLLVTYPNGTTHRLAPGPSSTIAKAVIEEFAPRFLKMPAVLWFSDSASKVREADVALAGRLGLHIDPAKTLPDIILVDVGAGSEALFVSSKSSRPTARSASEGSPICSAWPHPRASSQSAFSSSRRTSIAAAAVSSRRSPTWLCLHSPGFELSLPICSSIVDGRGTCRSWFDTAAATRGEPFSRLLPLRSGPLTRYAAP